MPSVVSIVGARSQFIKAALVSRALRRLTTARCPHTIGDRDRLRDNLTPLVEIAQYSPIVFPAHPRTRQAMEALDYQPGPGLHVIDPVGYLDILASQKNARLLLTDSGGMQKEAYLFGIPCLTLREETEWVETVEAGWNLLVGADREAIVGAARAFRPQGDPPPVFGDGRASEKIAALLAETMS